MRPLTPWGLKVKQRLIEKSMSTAGLARAVNACSPKYLSDMMYGVRSGQKYKTKIEKYLGLDD